MLATEVAVTHSWVVCLGGTQKLKCEMDIFAMTFTVQFVGDHAYRPDE